MAQWSATVKYGGARLRIGTGHKTLIKRELTDGVVPVSSARHHGTDTELLIDVIGELIREGAHAANFGLFGDAVGRFGGRVLSGRAIRQTALQ